MALIPVIRPAVRGDSIAIEGLMKYSDRVHRHLDWLSPVERLGEPSYWVLEQDFSVQAALSCPEDPPGVAWIRFFAAQPGYLLSAAFETLLDAVLKTYPHKPAWIVTVAIQGWFLRLLLEQQFQLHQAIVVLQLDPFHTSVPPPMQDIHLRPILPADLDEVTRVDHAAFAPIWRYSSQDIHSAYINSAYSTIIESGNEIVGYQISSASPFSAHLARLAVMPSMQGRGFGRQLTGDMIHHFVRLGVGLITVNTQSDNTASLELYKKIGFSLTGENFPVMKYQG
jgi:ribosomal protein S18 acetylase RimI-like enzyme